jgi:hypothetical protein
MAQAYNPSYSGGRVQEDHSSKPALGKIVPEFLRPYLKNNPSQKKRAGGVAQGVGPDFKPQYGKKIKGMLLVLVLRNPLELPI